MPGSGPQLAPPTLALPGGPAQDLAVASCSMCSLSAQGHSEPAGRGRTCGGRALGRAEGLPHRSQQVPRAMLGSSLYSPQPVACRLRTPPNWASGFASYPFLLPTRRAPGPGWLRTQVATLNLISSDSESWNHQSSEMSVLIWSAPSQSGAGLDPWREQPHTAGLLSPCWMQVSAYQGVARASRWWERAQREGRPSSP